MKHSDENRQSVKNIQNINSSLLVVFAAGLIVRIIAGLMYEGFSTDINLFRYWSQQAALNFTNIYKSASFIDYPPFYIYILFFIGKISQLFKLGSGSALMILLLKMPSILADLATAYILYRIAREKLSRSWCLLIPAVYLFNPAVWINASVWGQVDSFLTLLIAAGLLVLFSKKPYFSAAFLAAAILTKPQGLFVLPVLLFYVIKQRDIKLFFKMLGVGLGTAFLIILPFSFNQKPSWIIDLYFNTASGYKYASLNGFNFFSMIGANLKVDSEPFLFLTYKAWGMIFVCCVVLFSAYIYYKGKSAYLPYIAALVLTAGIFVFSVRMHERYLFPALYLLLTLFVLTRDKRVLALYGAASATVFINTYMVLIRMMRDNYPHVPPENPALLLVSLANVLICIAIFIWSWKYFCRNQGYSAADAKWLIDYSTGSSGNTRGNGKAGAAEESALGSKNPVYRWFVDKFIDGDKSDYPNALKLEKKDLIIMAVMTVIYFAIALINLGSFNAPKTGWASSQEDEGFMLDLGSEKFVSRLTLYSGLGEGSYDISYQNPHGAFEVVKTVETDVREFYRWLTVDIQQKTRYIKVSAEKPGGELKEAAVFGTDKNKPLKYTLTGMDFKPIEKGVLLNLSDEQDIASYKYSFSTGSYFDEIYHARTAYEHLHGIKPYEWTHPPLGKILISLGIAVFGMNPFGWRIVGTLFGALMIPLMYIFGKRLFKKSFYGFCAAFLMMFDLMHFAQTRIATIDVYTAFFVILAYYFMTDYYLSKPYERGFKKSLMPLLYCGISFGLGIAVKWSALYGAPGLALIFFLKKYNDYRDCKKMLASGIKPPEFKNKAKNWASDFMSLYINRTILYCFIFFGVIPVVIYFLSYIPYLFAPNIKVSTIFDYQVSMYRYHSGLDAEHFFSSPWWSWPLMVKPIWYYSGNDLPGGMASTISSFGNPAIWWVGILTFIASLIAAVKGNKAGLLISAAVLSQYLPWALVPRIAFIYHFFPILPFVMLSIVYVIKQLPDKGHRKAYVYCYLAVVALLFVVYYPVVSGMVVNSEYIKALRLFKTWYF